MSNPNDPTSFKREVSQDSFNDANGQTHVTRTDTTVNNPDAYKDGYVEGRVEENRYQENVLVERDNDNAARGLLLGILLTSLAALTAGAIWYFNQRNEVPAPVAPTILVPSNPPDPSPSPEVNQPPQSNTTIIERTREVPVIVPQQQAPAPQAPAAPDINISVPSSAPQSPATQPAPATQTSPSSTDNQPQSSTDNTTPAQGTSTQTDTTSSGDNSSATDTDTNTNPPQ